MTRRQAQKQGIRDIERETVTVARGKADLTTEEYWASSSIGSWGVMEIDTDFRKIQFAGTSIVWGMKSEDEAGLLAALMTHVMLACDEEHAGKKVYVPYGRPPCVIKIPIVPKGTNVKKKSAIMTPQILELAVPENFPVFYHDAAWSAFIAHFRDDYTIMEPIPDDLREDKQWMRELEKRVQTEAGLLPNEMWTHQGEMMLLQPVEGVEFAPSADDSEEDEDDESGDPMDVDGGEDEEEEDEDDDED